MRRKAKLIVPLALAIVVAIVAVSVADGGDGESQTKAGWKSYAPLAERDRGGAHDPDVAGVVGEVKDAAVKDAPEVAGPIISRSEQAGNITAAQADDLRAAAAGLAAGKSPRELAPTVDLRDWDVRVVIRDSLAALQRRAPEIAKPIIDEAVDKGQITESQAAQVREKIATGRHGGCRKGERERAPIGDSI